MTDKKDQLVPDRPPGITDQQWEDYLSKLRAWEDAPSDHFDGKPPMPSWPAPLPDKLPEGSILN